MSLSENISWNKSRNLSQDLYDWCFAIICNDHKTSALVTASLLTNDESALLLLTVATGWPSTLGPEGGGDASTGNGGCSIEAFSFRGTGTIQNVSFCCCMSVLLFRMCFTPALWLTIAWRPILRRSNVLQHTVHLALYGSSGTAWSQDANAESVSHSLLNLVFNFVAILAKCSLRS